MESLIHRLMERKLVQWVLAYLAGAWLLMQLVEVLSDRWPLPLALQRGTDLFLAVGFLATLVLAWFHGEKGRQRVSGPELVMLAMVLALAGWAVSIVDTEPSAPVADVGSGGAGLDPGPLALSSLADPAVAVLPFASSGNLTAEAFADGMHEEVVHALAQVSGLIVKSRQSVLRYRESHQTIAEIAEDLNADAVVQGSVRLVEERVQVTVQLIDPESEGHLWSRTFERMLSADQLFAIQEEIAREVAFALQVSITPEEEARLGHRPTGRLDARTVYLQALDTEGPERRRLVLLAIEMDPSYDRPWGVLAEIVGAQAFATSDVALADSAIALAEVALRLDPTQSSGDPHNAIGFAHSAKGDLDAARRAFLTGMERNPNDPAVVNNFGILLASAGRYPEAVTAFRRGIEISPRHVVNRTNLARVYEGLGLPDRADRMLDEVRALQPDRDEAAILSAELNAVRGNQNEAVAGFDAWLSGKPEPVRGEYLRAGARLALWAGDLDRARRWAARAHEGEPDVLPMQGGRMSGVTLGYVAIQEGDVAGGEALLAEAYEELLPFVEAGSAFPELSFELAAIEAARGRVPAAVRWLERAYQYGFRWYRDVELDPVFDAIRGDPALDRVMKRMRDDVAQMREQVVEMEAALELARERGGARPPDAK